MKKVIMSSIVAIALVASVATAQTSYACICIKGIWWEKACDQMIPPKPTTPTTPSIPTTPTTPTTPTETPKPTTPETPVIVASTVTKTETPAATPAAEVMPAELPQTGISGSALAVIALAASTYAGVYAAGRFLKR